jgi:hypothetical protein
MPHPGALLLLASLASGPAATPPADKPLDQVTVQAHRQALEQRLTTFVYAVARPELDESLKRWRRPMCPLVAGLPEREGEFVLERLSQIARDAHAPLAGETCHPNFYIVATMEPEELLKAWRHRDRTLYGGASPTQLAHFLKPDQAVRVWYNARFADAGGGVDPGAEGTEYNGRPVPTNHRAQGGRLMIADVLAFSSVIVIIDLRRVQGLSYGALTDYVAMLGLSQFDARANLGDAPTILQLFAAHPPQPAPAGLTEWDTALLKALYESEQAAFMQRSQIIQLMMRSIAP